MSKKFYDKTANFGGLRMQKILSLFLFLFVALSPLVSADSRPVIRVGYISGIGFLNENRPGHFEGYGYEYMEFLARYGNWKMIYVPCRSWKEMGEKLNAGEIDFLPAMPGDYKSLPFAKRTEHVVGRYSMGLITKDGKVKSHMKVGYIPYNAPIPSFPKVAKDQNFTYDLVPYVVHYDMADAFDKGEIDGYIAPILEPNKAKNVVADFDRQSYRLLIRADRNDLWAEANRAQDAMLMDQFDIRERLQNKYLRKGGVPLILSRSEQEYLDEKKTLKVAIQTTVQPYGYYDGKEAKGVIPALVEQMGNDLNIGIEFVKTDTREDALKLLELGKVDILADILCDFSWAATVNAVPTASYINFDFVAVRRRDDEARDSDIAALIADEPYTPNFIEPLYGEDKRFYVKSIQEGFRAVNESRADVVFAPRSEVPYLIEQTGTYNLEAETETLFQMPVALGIYQGADPRLWRIMSKEISHLDITKLHDMMSASRTGQNITPQWILYHYPMRVLGALMLIIGAIGFILYSRYRMRRIHYAEVERVADTDMRYDLPNIRYLTKVAPDLVEAALAKNPDIQLYTMIFSMNSKTAVALPYGEELLISQLKTMAEQLKAESHVLAVAAGNDAGHLVLLAECENDEYALSLAAAVVEDYGYIITPEARIWLHMQGGLAHYDENVTLSVEQAHIASHEAKNSPNHVQIFDDKLKENLEFDQKIENIMENSLKNGEFVPWYQPKYDIKTKKIVGAEALVRWISKDMGFLPPGKFIPLFEQNGFVIPVDHYLLEEVFKFQRRALDEGKKPVTISVNQSRLHMTEENYLGKIRALVKKYKLPKGLIELELTETVFGDLDQKRERENAIHIIKSLKEMGFTISVDDFGSGYSSYTLLNYLPMDVMKIDRSLLVASDDSDRMQSILKNIIELGHLLNMKVLCEGIETTEQEELLLSLGCRYGQGYLNSKPLPEKDFLVFWAAHE